MANDIDPERLARFVKELERCPTIVAEMAPASAVHIVGLLQLALRHPQPSEQSRALAHKFIDHVRGAFVNAPTILGIIEEGEHE